MRAKEGECVREREYTMNVFEHSVGQQRQLVAGVRRLAATVVVLTHMIHGDALVFGVLHSGFD